MSFVSNHYMITGFRLMLYALDYFHGMWRVMMIDECYISSSNADRESRIETYCVLKGVMDAVGKEAENVRMMLNSRAYNEVNSMTSVRKRQRE